MQILETPPIHGAEIRSALISSKLLRPARECPAPALSSRDCVRLDPPAFLEIAREILRAHGRDAAHAIALERSTDPRVVASLFDLLGSEPPARARALDLHQL